MEILLTQFFHFQTYMVKRGSQGTIFPPSMWWVSNLPMLPTSYLIFTRALTTGTVCTGIRNPFYDNVWSPGQPPLTDWVLIDSLWWDWCWYRYLMYSKTHVYNLLTGINYTHIILIQAERNYLSIWLPEAPQSSPPLCPHLSSAPPLKSSHTPFVNKSNDKERQEQVHGPKHLGEGKKIVRNDQQSW